MSRGVDQLSDWAEVVSGSPPKAHLQLRCTNDIASQVERRLDGVAGARLRLRSEDREEWTHRYPLSRGLDNSEKAFLELLTKVLTLRIGPPVTVGIALDYYKDPASHQDPAEWSNTAAGELVHRGKYEGSDAAGKELADHLASIAQRHPDLRNADVVVTVPSHSPRKFSERLGRRVATRLEIPIAVLFDDVGSPQKETDPAERPLVSYRLEPEGGVGDKAALVIDDVVRTGESMRSVARFLDESGASSVCVLAGVRTMRN